MADIREFEAASVTANVTLTTTTEEALVSIARITLPTDEARVVILGWFQITSGAGTTAITPRIRRGTTVSAALVGEANAVALGAAAGETEHLVIQVADELRLTDTVEYVLTVQQTGATGNGTALQAAIAVFVF